MKNRLRIPKLDSIINKPSIDGHDFSQFPMDSQDRQQSEFDTARSIEANKVENKNSFMRPESSTVKRVLQIENWLNQNKAKQRKSGIGLPSQSSIEQLENERILNMLIETSFLSEFTQHSNPELQAQIKKDELHWKFNSTMNAMQGGLRKNYVIKEYEKLAANELA